MKDMYNDVIQAFNAGYAQGRKDLMEQDAEEMRKMNEEWVQNVRESQLLMLKLCCNYVGKKYGPEEEVTMYESLNDMLF